MESLDSSNHIHQVDDREISYEDLVQYEHAQKGKALERILQAKRERSGSNLSSLDKIPDRTPRVAIAELSVDGDDDDDSEDGEEDGEAGTDLRKALFEAIPEPYPHTLNYQRVIISDAGDPLDPDTRDACKKLKQCMAIRDKWIGAHPYPPQDVAKDSPTQQVPDIGSPERPGRNGSKKNKADVDYRRRLPPTYEIFEVPLPPTIGHLRFKMVEGVVRVQSVAPTTAAIGNGASGPNGESAVGLSITTESSSEIHDPVGTAITDLGQGQAKGCAEGEDEVEEIDWSTSLYPVHSFKEYVQDYNFVSRPCVVDFCCATWRRHTSCVVCLCCSLWYLLDPSIFSTLLRRCARRSTPAT